MGYESKSWRDSMGRPRDPSHDLEQTFEDLESTIRTRTQRIKVAKETGKYKLPNMEEAEREQLADGASHAVLLLRSHVNGKLSLMNAKLIFTWAAMVAQWAAIAVLIQHALKG